jgi:putative component of membrane protein insertase Oxa1/YidC/SpoIIIJ protein YidD
MVTRIANHPTPYAALAGLPPQTAVWAASAAPSPMTITPLAAAPVDQLTRFGHGNDACDEDACEKNDSNELKDFKLPEPGLPWLGFKAIRGYQYVTRKVPVISDIYQSLVICPHKFEAERDLSCSEFGEETMKSDFNPAWKLALTTMRVLSCTPFTYNSAVGDMFDHPLPFGEFVRKWRETVTWDNAFKNNLKDQSLGQSLAGLPFGIGKALRQTSLVSPEDRKAVEAFEAKYKKHREAQNAHFDAVTRAIEKAKAVQKQTENASGRSKAAEGGIPKFSGRGGLLHTDQGGAAPGFGAAQLGVQRENPFFNVIDVPAAGLQRQYV